MSIDYEKLEKEIRSLSSRKKAELARTLIEDLDTESDQDAELIWEEEAKRRYHAYQAGKLTAIPGEEAMQRARHKLK